jgi:hypothetical protein
MDGKNTAQRSKSGDQYPSSILKTVSTQNDKANITKLVKKASGVSSPAKSRRDVQRHFYISIYILKLHHSVYKKSIKFTRNSRKI